MIRPYLRDLINNHKPTEKLNNDSERGEYKIQLIMQIIVFLFNVLKILAPYIQQVNL